jgi:hypothetical protein
LIGGSRLILRPNCHAGVKNPCAILIRLTRRRGLLAVDATGWRRFTSAKTDDFGRPPQAQAAPGEAAAEEILVPMDHNILAGPANRAIAFRVLVVTSRRHPAGNV